MKALIVTFPMSLTRAHGCCSKLKHGRTQNPPSLHAAIVPGEAKWLFIYPRNVLKGSSLLCHKLDEVAFRGYPGQPVAVNDGQAADLAFDHQLGGFCESCVGRGRLDLTGHYFFDGYGTQDLILGPRTKAERSQ